MNMKETLDLYELVIDESTDDEVFALSLVSEPAIMSNFMYFNKDGKQLEVKFASVDDEKRLIVGAILIPDLRMIRQDSPNEKPYEVFFSKDTVRQAAQKYLADNHTNDITIEHKKPVDGVSLVESWIVDSTVYDKSKAYGLNLKVGTWAGVFKVNNLKVWDEVKAGDYKGISLEGIFSHLKTNLSAVKTITELNNDEAQILLGKIKGIILEGQPSVASSYPGEAASGSISPATFKEGVPHYLYDGTLYEGPTHKDAEGRLMTGETHTEDSKYLYHV